MTFIVRKINLQFLQANNKVVNLQGLRCTAIIYNPGGNNGVAQLQLKVYGMTLDQMNQYSSSGSNLVVNENYGITVSAGNEGSTPTQIFEGGIISSYIDFSSVPDVAFVCVAQAGLFQQAAMTATRSWEGAQNAETLIESLTALMGENWTFKNNGAHFVLQNPSYSGSIQEQIKKIAADSSFPLSIENNTVSIWENTGVKNDTIINLSATNGLVGYPSYYPAGFIVKSEFNPQISIGCTINLKSVIPKANGAFSIYSSTHELSTLTPGGPWFTSATLSITGTPYVN